VRLIVRNIKNWGKLRKAETDRLIPNMFDDGTNIRKAHVHHIKRYTDGGSSKPNNLIAMPDSVHREIHKCDKDPKLKKFYQDFLRKHKDNPF
jgi:hypothetical protein